MTKDAHHLYDFDKPIRPMTCKYRPFSPTRPPKPEQAIALVRWANKVREINRRSDKKKGK